MLSSEQEIELKALYEPMLQTKILPNFHSFPYLLMSSSRGKVKPRAGFFGGMRLIGCPWMRLGCSDIHTEQEKPPQVLL